MRHVVVLRAAGDIAEGDFKDIYELYPPHYPVIVKYVKSPTEGSMPEEDFVSMMDELNTQYAHVNEAMDLRAAELRLAWEMTLEEDR